jgi:GNAT superfamily N-acetyltransferase
MAGQSGEPCPDSVVLRPYEHGDEREIAGLFEICFGKRLPPEHWEWKYTKNPYGNRSVMVVVTDGRITGHYGAYPVHIEDGRRGRVRALHVGDIMTDPRVRGMGVGRRSVIARVTHAFYEEFCEGRVAFNFGAPAERHLRLGTMVMSYQSVGPILLWTREGNRESRSGRRKVLSRLTRRRHTVEESRSIDAAAPDLYEKMKDSLGISLRREEAYLRWRYLMCPGKDYRFYRITRGGRLALWAVAAREGDDVLLGDVLVEPGEAHLFTHLVEELLRRWPGLSIKVWAPTSVHWWADMLSRAGFTCAPHPFGIHACLTIFDEEHYPAGRMQEEWFYAMGDFDLF